MNGSLNSLSTNASVGQCQLSLSRHLPSAMAQVICSCKQRFTPCRHLTLFASAGRFSLHTLSMWTSGAPQTEHLGDLSFLTWTEMLQRSAQPFRLKRGCGCYAGYHCHPKPGQLPRAPRGETHCCGTRLCRKAVQWPLSTLICPDEGEGWGLLL